MISRISGITLAILVHAAILLFGGIFFLNSRSTEGKQKSVDNVELLSTPEEEKKKDKTPEAEAKSEEEAKEEQEKAQEIQQREDVPDLKELEKLDAAAAAPALDAMSLSALEDALSSSDGSAGDAGFGANAVDFSSGGRIGGVGRAIDAQDGGVDQAFAIADLDQKPRPILQPAPQYPWELRQRKIEGTVSVLFIVDETGRVVNPKIETSPNAGFERPVLEALRQWRFEAAVRGGKKVAARMRIPIRFRASQS